MSSHLGTSLVVAVALSVAAPCAAAQGTTWNEHWVGSEWEVYTRALGARGLVEVDAWSIRPLAPGSIGAMARSIGIRHPWSQRLPRTDSLPQASLLRPAIGSSYNAGFAWGMNDGAVWQGRGVNVWGTAGAAARWGIFSARIEPLVARAANTSFELRPAVHRAPYGSPIGGIDLPQRFGDAPATRVDLGESHARIDVGGVAAGFSSEILGWGPGIRQGLLFGSNAAGFHHLFLGTSRPASTPVGKFGVQLVYGALEQSEWAQLDSPTRRRFGTGLIGVWVPFDQPIEVGFSRFYHRAWPSGFRVGDLGAPFGSLFYDDEVFGGGDADNQIASVFATARVHSLGVDVFGEFARNDRSSHLRDFALEPEHNSAWMIGLLHATRPDTAASRFWTTRIEVANARISRIQDIGRGQALFYGHGQISQGHTSRGELLGSPLAEQSGGIELSVDRWARWGRAGFTIMERQLPGDRLVGMPAGAERSQWDIGATTTLFRGAADIHAQMGHVWDINRFPGRDVGSFYVRLGGRADMASLFAR